MNFPALRQLVLYLWSKYLWSRYVCNPESLIIL